MFKPILVAAVCVLVVVSASATSFVMPTDDEMIAKSPAIVTGVIEGSYVRTAGTMVVTTYELRVSKSYKGPFHQGELAKISSPGGYIDGVGGVLVESAAHFAQGDEVLLFLNQASYGWTPTDLTLGKFRFVTSTAGDKLLLRDEENIGVSSRSGAVHNEPVRREAGFLRFVEQRVQGHAAASDYVVDSSKVTLPVVKSSDRFTMETNTYTPGSYTSNLTCTPGNGGCNPQVTRPTRWLTSTMNAGITFARFNSISGAGDGGASVIQNALAAWNNDCASATNLIYGTTATGPANFDGINVVAFNDPNATIGGSWTGSGTVAVTYTSYTTATHNFGGTDFFAITSADIVYQDGYTAAEASFLTTMTHEVGHAIGWRHSNATPLSGGDQTVTCNGTTEDCTPTKTAIMFWQAGSFGNTLQPWDQNAVRAVYPGGSCVKRGDSNGDGIADIFWHRDTGENFLWQLDNTGHLASPLGLPTLPASWSVAATGDYNGDGKTDFFLRDQAAGQNYLWMFDGSTLIANGPLPPVDSNWSVAGSGDFDGDGKSDILWRRITGEDYIWLLNGTTLVSNGPIHTVDPTWTLRVGGDITGDGKADIFLRQNTTGINYLWTMNGISVVAAANLPTVDTNWDIAALVDLNGDAKSDIFWRRNTGDNYVWLLDGAILASNAPLPPIADTNWRVVGWGDFDGDGDGDIFWRHLLTGETYLWRMNGTTLAIPQPLYTIETAWKIVGPR